MTSSSAPDLKTLGLRYLSTLPAPVREKLAPLLNLKCYKKGDLWDLQKRSTPAFAIVIEGLVEQVRTNSSGAATSPQASTPLSQHVMTLVGPFETLNLASYLSGEPCNAQTRICSRTAVLYESRVTSREFREHMRSSPEFQDWILKQMLANEHALEDKIFILSAGRLQTKLYEFFQNLADRFAHRIGGQVGATPAVQLAAGSSQSEAVIELPFHLTKTQVARMIDARVETVIRALNKWERLGHIRFDHDHLQLIHFGQLQAQLHRAEKI